MFHIPSLSLPYTVLSAFFIFSISMLSASRGRVMIRERTRKDRQGAFAARRVRREESSEPQSPEGARCRPSGPRAWKTQRASPSLGTLYEKGRLAFAGTEDVRYLCVPAPEPCDPGDPRAGYAHYGKRPELKRKHHGVQITAGHSGK